MIKGRKARIGTLIFILFSLIYFLTVKGFLGISDTDRSVDTAKAIVENGHLSIGVSEVKGPRVEPAEHYYVTKDGKKYSVYGVGLAFIFVPYVLLGKAIVALTGIPEILVTEFLISFYNIFFGAGTCALMFFVADLFKISKRTSIIMAFLLGLGTACWRYTVWDFSEVTQMFFLMLSIYCVLKNTGKSLIIGSFAYSCLILVKVVYVIYLPVFLLYIFFRNRQSKLKSIEYKYIFTFLPLIALTSAFILLLNYMRFGEIFEFGYGEYARAFYISWVKTNVPKLLFGINTGIFIYNPVVLLGFLGYLSFFKLFRKEAAFFFSLIAINLTLTSMRYGWSGAWAWGPRYLVPFIPLWLIPAYDFLSKKGVIKAVVIFIVSFSLFIQMISVLIRTHEYLYIKNHLVGEDVKNDMPGDVIGSFILLKHKILKGDNIYNLQEFGLNKDATVSTHEFISKRGLNLWYCHLARRFKKPKIKYFPILFIPVLAVIVKKLLIEARAND
jgi:hypothetical protein